MDVKDFYGSSDGIGWKEAWDPKVLPMLPEIWNEVQKELHTDSDKELVFVSPAANIGTHELALFKQEDILKRKGKTKFIIGDLVVKPSTDLVKQMQNQSREDKWISFVNMNGSSIPLGNSQADFVWDRRGALWHEAMDKKQKGAIATLQEYERILKPGGVIILDADLGFNAGLGEYSTLHQLNETFSTETLYREDKDGQQIFCTEFIEDPFVSANFDIKYVGKDNNRTALLIKKNKSL